MNYKSQNKTYIERLIFAAKFLSENGSEEEQSFGRGCLILYNNCFDDKKPNNWITKNSLVNPAWFSVNYLANVLLEYGSEKEKKLGRCYLNLQEKYSKRICVDNESGDDIENEFRKAMEPIRIKIKQIFKDYKQRYKTEKANDYYG